mgnify:CR=1 FL=1
MFHIAKSTSLPFFCFTPHWCVVPSSNYISQNLVLENTGICRLLNTLRFIFLSPLWLLRRSITKLQFERVFSQTRLIRQVTKQPEMDNTHNWFYTENGKTHVKQLERVLLSTRLNDCHSELALPIQSDQFVESAQISNLRPEEKLIQRDTTRGVAETIWQRCRFHWQSWLCFNARYGGVLVKRFFDIVVSMSLLLLLTPLAFAVVLAIHLESPGQAFFYQTRVGKHGRLFKMWKFRSMYIDAEERKAALLKYNYMPDGVLFKMKNDPRITRVGKFIRKFSIDEIPQFWNVLRGEMSVVGPRPSLPHEVAKYNAYQYQRLEVKPGITCIWQVSGRSEIPFPQQVEMDLQYITTQSFFGDIVLLLKTIPAVLKSRGAY